MDVLWTGLPPLLTPVKKVENLAKCTGKTTGSSSTIEDLKYFFKG